MVRRFSLWLRIASSGQVAAAGLIIFLLFTAIVLPRQTSGRQASMEEAGTPDLSLYYSAEELYHMAEGYGEDGRADYIQARFTFDLLWPLVYTFFLATSISWLTHNSLADSRIQLANLAPVAAAILDYLENISTSLVMARYPLLTPVVAQLAGVFTLLKWAFVGGSFLLLLIAIAIFLGKRFIRSTSRKS